MLKYGLVLAGGGSLGAYEIGCIKRLLELDFRFDIITGTSIGSINGAMLALNCFDQLLKIWNNIEIANIIENGDFSRGFEDWWITKDDTAVCEIENQEVIIESKSNKKEILYRLLEYSLFEESLNDGNEMNDEAIFEYKYFDNY